MEILVRGGGGNIPSLFASIKGNENISLQYISNNNKVSNSITFTSDNDTYNSILFAGNNTEFTGTLYLHPAITNLKFASKKSVITNISIPNVEINTGKDRDVNPFVKSRNMKIICFYLPDNKDFGRLNINGNVTVDLINNCKKPTYLSFTEINKSSMYSLAVHDKIDLIINKYNDNYYSKCKCKCHKNNTKLLRNININCEEYKENTANKFTTLSCTATAKWQNGESVFEYVLKCSNCNNKQIKTKSSLKHGIEHYTKYGKYFWTSDEIFKQLSQQSCSKCKYNFNKTKINIATKSSSYLMFHDKHVDARKRLWSLCCSTCNNAFCKLEVVKTYERENVPTIEYDGTIDDLKLKISTYKDYICTKCNMLNSPIEIPQTQLILYNNYISDKNCIYTGNIKSDGSYFGTYDLYCNECGFHTPSINHGTNSLLTNENDIINKFKEKNGESDKCTKCNTTFDKNTFAPNNTIKQANISFYPYYDAGKNAYCKFISHINLPISIPPDTVYPAFTSSLDNYIAAIKEQYIGKICNSKLIVPNLKRNNGCGARLVSAVYRDKDGSFKYVDVDDCTIKDEEAVPEIDLPGGGFDVPPPEAQRLIIEA